MVFQGYINEMHDSISKIPSKKLVRQRCKGFSFGVKGLLNQNISNSYPSTFEFNTFLNLVFYHWVIALQYKNNLETRY
jgi:hypothetical protein